jgi:hypothetical protein
MKPRALGLALLFAVLYVGCGDDAPSPSPAGVDASRDGFHEAASFDSASDAPGDAPAIDVEAAASSDSSSIEAASDTAGSSDVTTDSAGSSDVTSDSGPMSDAGAENESSSDAAAESTATSDAADDAADAGDDAEPSTACSVYCACVFEASASAPSAIRLPSSASISASTPGVSTVCSSADRADHDAHFCAALEPRSGIFLGAECMLGQEYGREHGAERAGVAERPRTERQHSHRRSVDRQSIAGERSGLVGLERDPARRTL